MCPNLMAISGPNLMKKRITKELDHLKHLSLKIQEVTSKNVAITAKKVEQCVRHIKCTNQGHLSTNNTPDIDFTDEPVVQYDASVVKNTFFDDCK